MSRRFLFADAPTSAARRRRAEQSLDVLSSSLLPATVAISASDPSILFDLIRNYFSYYESRPHRAAPHLNSLRAVPSCAAFGFCCFALLCIDLI